MSIMPMPPVEGISLTLQEMDRNDALDTTTCNDPAIPGCTRVPSFRLFLIYLLNAWWFIKLSLQHLYCLGIMFNIRALHVRSVEDVISRYDPEPPEEDISTSFSPEGELLDPFAVLVRQHSVQWKVIMTISALFFAAIATCLQIPGFANNDTTRTLGVFCIISTITSIVVSGVMQLRFLQFPRENVFLWARDARKLSVSKWLNVPILLTAPTAWLAWSVVFFSIFLVVALWLGSTAPDSQGPSDYRTFGSYISAMMLLGLATVHTAITLKVFWSIGSGRL